VTTIDERSPNAQFLIGLARAAAGALIFSLPILMTMEMWELGVTMPPSRLALLTATTLPLLVGLSYYVGFEETATLLDDVLDACAAYGVAFVTSLVVLFALAVIDTTSPPRDILGRVALQVVPASIGALLAQSELGVSRERKQDHTRQPGYPGSLFLMAVGALYLAFNVAPTEEIQLVAFKITPTHAIGLVLGSLLIMHALVYSVEFTGSPPEPRETPWWSLLLRYTVVGYALTLLLSMYTLWTFGRLDAVDAPYAVMLGITLAFPGAVGAAAARLIF
jgi:putative integral membrane protein (TIGR02587 family)